MRNIYGSNNPNWRSCHITKDIIRGLYLDQQRSTTECAKILNIGRATLGRHMKRFGIKARSISEACRGEKASGWKGGRLKLTNCLYCDKEFETHMWFMENGWGKYCSNQCSTLSKVKRVEKVCEHCGSKFEAQEHRKDTHRYCSHECKSKGQLLGEDVRCYVCNKRTYKDRARLKRCNKFYCSTECRDLNNSGPLNSQWKGGKKSEPYCYSWKDSEFKSFIKERDSHRCQNPDCWKTFNNLSIHHIDYDKKNCHPDNLITVCVSCNSRANVDRRWHKSWYNAIMQRSGKTININQLNI